MPEPLSMDHSEVPTILQWNEHAYSCLHDGNHGSASTIRTTRSSTGATGAAAGATHPAAAAAHQPAVQPAALEAHPPAAQPTALEVLGGPGKVAISDSLTSGRGGISAGSPTVAAP